MSHVMLSPTSTSPLSHPLKPAPEASKCHQKRRWREQDSQPAVRTIEEKAAAFWESLQTDQSSPIRFSCILPPIPPHQFSYLVSEDEKVGKKSLGSVSSVRILSLYSRSLIYPKAPAMRCSPFFTLSYHGYLNPFLCCSNRPV
jgi:hypothetical protein